MINHFLLQPRPRRRLAPLGGARRPGWRKNGIMAQVIGAGPSLISDLINLIKAASLVA